MFYRGARCDRRESVFVPQASDHSVVSKSYALTDLPVAIDDAASVVRLSLASTLVVGKSGSGKGSVLHAVSRAALPHAAGGFCELWGIDPKRAELAGPASSLFARLAFRPEEILDLLRRLHAVMTSRQGGRAFEASREMRLIILQFDEITTAFLPFGRREAEEAMRLLRILLLQGRSAGILVFAYGQDATKEATILRDDFSQRVCLRMQTAAETDLVLGHGAVALGAASHLIAVASITNNYATAGVGYVRSIAGEVIKVRFPFTSDHDLHALAAAYQPLLPGASDA